MADHLVKLNMRFSGLAPWWCPVCQVYSIHYKLERVVRWSLAKGVFCCNECGIAGKLIGDKVVPDSGVYELYAPERLIPKLVARKLRGELDGPRSSVEELYRQAGMSFNPMVIDSGSNLVSSGVVASNTVVYQDGK